MKYILLVLCSVLSYCSSVAQLTDSLVLSSSLTPGFETFNGTYFHKNSYQDISCLTISSPLIVEEVESYNDHTDTNSWLVDDVFQLPNGFVLCAGTLSNQHTTSQLFLLQKEGDVLNGDKITFLKDITFDSLVNTLLNIPQADRLPYLLDSSWVNLTRHFPKVTFDRLMSLPTLEEQDYPTIRRLFIDRFGLSDTAYGEFLYTSISLKPGGYDNYKLSLGLIDLLIEEGYEPYGSSNTFIQHESGRNKYVIETYYHTSSPSVIHYLLALGSLLFIILAIVWVISLTRVTQRSKPLQTLLAVGGHIGFCLIGFGLGLVIGLSIGQVLGYTGGDSIMSAVMAIFTGFGGIIVALIAAQWLHKRAKKKRQQTNLV